MASAPPDPDYVGEILTDVREQIAVDDDVLSETKERRKHLGAQLSAVQLCWSFAQLQRKGGPQ